jgi:hypothetical protein
MTRSEAAGRAGRSLWISSSPPLGTPATDPGLKSHRTSTTPRGASVTGNIAELLMPKFDWLATAVPLTVSGLAQRGHPSLPDGVTAHEPRHTFGLIPFVRGEDPPYVMVQLGHTDPAFSCASTPTRCAATTATRSG